MAQAEAWAIIDEGGRPICDYSGLDSFEDSSDATVPMEPQENGQVYAYDKVPNPNEVSVSLLFSGDYVLQQAALNRLEQCRVGTELFTIVTPARVCSRMALVSYSTMRSATNGANMLEVTCRFQEIRNASVGQQTAVWQPKNATSAGTVNTGQKQPEGSFAADALGLNGRPPT